MTPFMRGAAAEHHEVFFSIVVPTISGAHLRRAMQSLRHQSLVAGDRIFIVGDGPQPAARALCAEFGPPFAYYEHWAGTHEGRGSPQRNYAISIATPGSYFMALDEDDVRLPDALATARRLISEKPGVPHFFLHETFRVRTTLPKHPTVTEGEIDGHSIVCPIKRGRIGSWTMRYQSDADFIAETVRLNGGVEACAWHLDTALSVARPELGSALCPAGWPPEKERGRLFSLLHEKDPYAAAEILPADEQGWNDHSEHFKRLLKNASLVVELGSWKGASAIALAAAATEAEILCVDTWVTPGVEDVFLSNIIRRGLQRRVTPFKTSSLLAIERLKELRETPDLIYIDADHSEEAVAGDIIGSLSLAPRIICGDDYAPDWPGVVRAVDRLLPNRLVDGRFWWIEQPAYPVTPTPPPPPTVTRRIYTGRTGKNGTKPGSRELRKVWGPKAWKRLHEGALAAETAEARQSLVDEITRGVPCGTCRKHWGEVLAELPPRTGTAEEFFQWSVEAHNLVNARKDSPAPAMSIEDARRRWGE